MIKRLPTAAAVFSAAALAGLLAAGCGSSSSSSTTSTTSTASAANLTPRQWLTANAEHWSKQLNTDQNGVDTAAGAAAATGTSANPGSSSTYFSHLTSACTKLRNHAEQAEKAPKAPTTALQSAWNAMLSATVTYASKCLEVAHSNSSGNDVTAWQNTLTSMNAANDAFNRIADAAASVSGNSSTTTTRPT